MGETAATVTLIMRFLLLLLTLYVLMISLTLAQSMGAMNVLVRYLGTGVACLMLLGVVLRTSGTLAGEREGRTLDGLLTTTLSNRNILLEKGVGGVLSVRQAWIILGLIYAVALYAEGLKPLALVFSVGAWWVYAAFAAGLGMWFSLVSRSSLVANVGAVLMAILLSAGPWVIWCLVRDYCYPRGFPSWVPEFNDFMFYGTIPPVSLGVLAFQNRDFEPGSKLRLTWGIVECAVLGVACYGAIAAGLWGGLLTCFGRMTGRMPVGRKQQSSPPGVVNPE
jgi:hypothetical protein